MVKNCRLWKERFVGRRTPTKSSSLIDKEMSEKKEVKMIQFFIPMKLPNVTHQEHKIGVRNNKPYTYEPPELKAARALFRDSFAPFAPKEPLSGAVFLEVHFTYQEDAEHPAGSLKTTKPDTDNLIKLPKDVMTELGFWKDDAQVCCETIMKYYDAVPGIFVSVKDR